jgi:hypothetical protein
MLLRMMNVSDIVEEKVKTCILYLITFFENLAFYGIMWKNMIELGRPQMTI